MGQILIKKADGTTEVFKEEKLRRSLKRSGARKNDIDTVVERVIKEVKPYTTTGEIYRKAFHILSQLGGVSAAKYSLRKSIMQLGPSGFPFERFMAKVLEEKGYKTRVGVDVGGKCASHEVDIVAENNEKLILVEAKFHNKGGVKSDMKVVLYVHARDRDLCEGKHQGLDTSGKKVEYWIVTNTKFTKNSIRYGECAGLRLIGWSYPNEGNIQDMIEDSGLQPLTCLTNLENREKETLLNRGIVLCKSVVENPNLLSETGVDNQRKEKVIQEARELCA